jgi:hypothetical protein
MKIDRVLGTDVSRDIKERLENIYGITDTATIGRVLDCVADNIEDQFITGSGENDIISLIIAKEVHDDLVRLHEYVTSAIDTLVDKADNMGKSELLEAIDTIWRSY